MDSDQLDQFFTLLRAEFETLGRKLANRGMMVREWQRALKPVDKSLAENALRKWLWKFNTEPTLEKFMDIVDEIASDSIRNRPASTTSEVKDVVSETLDRFVAQERTPDDILWVKLHRRLFHQLANVNREEKAEIREQFYRSMAEEHPQFAGDCAQVLASIGYEEAPTSTLDDLPF